MAAEPLLLPRTAQIGQVLLQTRQFKKFVLGCWNVLADDYIVEENVSYIVIVDAAGRAVFVTVLARGSPKVSLYI